MKKVSLLILFLLLSRQAQAGSVEFSTYYPAPYGVYDRLRLNAHTADLSQPCEPGTLYVRSPGILKFCDSAMAWQTLNGDTVWTQTNQDIYLTDTAPNIFVGIGTSAPEFKLTLDQDGGILAKGTFGSGTILTTAGAGERLIWYPRKAAFRVGSVAGTQWDDINIGDYSTVTGGLNNTASGAYSVVGGGNGNTASATHATVTGGTGNIAGGNYSVISGGFQNQATGIFSVVTGGELNQATGGHSVVSGGIWNTAAGDFSVISGGYQNQALGSHSVISGGRNNIANANFSTITGGIGHTVNGLYAAISGGAYNTAGGDFSVISGGNLNTASGAHAAVTGGRLNTASGAASVVSGGEGNSAAGDYSAVSGGLNNQANGYAAVAAGGEGNSATGDYSWAGGRNMRLSALADRTFLWGHAALPITPVDTPDAFIIYSGNVGIGTANPDPLVKLHINGNLRADVLTDLGVASAPMNYNTGSQMIGFDIAERFKTDEEVKPGDLVVIDKTGNHRHGKSKVSYDPGIIGVVSAAPAILFEGSELEIAPAPGGFTQGTNPPVALAGRVRCKVTTESGPIRPGDLLTSSSTPGHAMKAVDPEKSYGAIIGKALEAFPAHSEEVKTGTIMILVM